ncbi:MAG: hypothetical protein OEV19_01925, partial [Candidatus Bathyarchaeota archaeon]|nr:hypothetical protein [Candidatus Bathyarchaeota archaeon]
ESEDGEHVSRLANPAAPTLSTLSIQWFLKPPPHFSELFSEKILFSTFHCYLDPNRGPWGGFSMF